MNESALLDQLSLSRNDAVDGPTFVDLFSGAGGLGLGFCNAGFKLASAIDNKLVACNTYKTNVGPNVINVDIQEDIVLPPATVIVGGPPCQGFSSAGLRRRDDKRNTLTSIFSKVVARYRPNAFVFENVEGFLTTDNGQRVLDLLEPLIEAGYRVHLRKINAANYGVPQHRKRVFAIGGLGWDPTFPLPTYSAYGAPGAHLAGSHLTPTPTLCEALEGLPPPAENPQGVPSGHYSRNLNGMELRRIAALRIGETMRDLPEELKHKSYTKRAFRRVIDGTPCEQRGGPPAGIRRLRPDEPCKAITSAATTEFVHPFENRCLTLRECSRIQTFPDEFVFLGTTTEQAQLICDAVPPLLATKIAISLMRDLQLQHPRSNLGALLSFVPTLSLGTSPALERTIDLVRQRFATKSERKEQLVIWR